MPALDRSSITLLSGISKGILEEARVIIQFVMLMLGLFCSGHEDSGLYG